MEWFLVFDANCPVCNGLAKEIDASAEGKLQALSIQSNKAKTLLNQVYPSGWDFAPYLIVNSPEKTKAWTGVRAALRLGMLVGSKKALRFWNLARQYGAILPTSEKIPTHYGQTRRWVLKSLVGVGLGGVLAKTLGLQIMDVTPVFANHSCSACYGGCTQAGSSTGCTCHPACGSCACLADYYHQLWCYCYGQIKSCVFIACNTGCGTCA